MEEAYSSKVKIYAILRISNRYGQGKKNRSIQDSIKI